MPDAQNIYWNPVLETLPADRMQDLQLKEFKRIFTWAYGHSKFHRSLYANAGLKPDDIRTFRVLYFPGRLRVTVATAP